MPANISQKAHEAVVGCLGLYDHLTVEEIMEFTDLSKSTVYRVVNSDDRISSSKGKGKAWLFKIDKEAVARDFRVDSIRVRRELERDKDVANNLERMKSRPVKEQIEVWSRNLAIVTAVLEQMEEQQFNALALQRDVVTIDPDAAQAHWNAWRSKLEDIGTMAATLVGYCDSIADHHTARSPLWWTQFPKEQ